MLSEKERGKFTQCDCKFKHKELNTKITILHPATP